MLNSQTPPKIKDTICTKIDKVHFENNLGVYEISLKKVDGSKNYYISLTGQEMK